MKFRTGFFNVSLDAPALPASPVASGWYRQCFAGLKARLEVGIVSVEGESGSRPRAEHRQCLSVPCASQNGPAWHWQVGSQAAVSGAEG